VLRWQRACVAASLNNLFDSSFNQQLVCALGANIGIRPAQQCRRMTQSAAQRRQQVHAMITTAALSLVKEGRRLHPLHRPCYLKSEHETASDVNLFSLFHFMSSTVSSCPFCNKYNQVTVAKQINPPYRPGRVVPLSTTRDRRREWRWRVEGGGRRVEGGGWRVEGGGWRVEGGGWRVEGGGWRV
jgi:hypothetical protein